jgi:predicted outer membrane repeat protein
VTVTTLADMVDFGDGVTSLREAVFATNLVGGADTINFDPALTSDGPATLLLTQGELAISDSLTIVGPGANLLTIEAYDPTPADNNGDGSRIFKIDDANDANVLDVSVSGLMLTGGDISPINVAAELGGAIYSRENLDVIACTIRDNAARGGGGAIAVFNSYATTLSVIDCTVTNNSVPGAFAGGGIYAGSYYDGTISVELRHSTVSNNSTLGEGGGIDVDGGNLTVTESTISGNISNKPASGGFAAGSGGGIWIRHANNFEVTGSTISGNSALGSGGGIYGTPLNFSVTDTIFSNNMAGTAGGGLSISGSGTVHGGSFAGNKATGNGGAIAGTLNIDGSTISGNTAGGSGGGFYGAGSIAGAAISANSAGTAGGGGVQVSNAGALAISNSQINGNSTTGSGGGIQVPSGATLSVTGGTIDDNTAVLDGGGLRTLGTSLTMSGVSLTGDKASRDGGAMAIAAGTVSVALGTLNGNAANGGITSDGGAIFMSFGTLTVTDSTISNNTAIATGGGISKTSGNLTLTRSTITGNSSTGTTTSNGGGIRSSSGNVTVTDSTVASNSSSRDGGGIYVGSSSITAITGSTISSNTAARDGAGIWKGFSSTLTVTSSTISGNTASDDGGGIYSLGPVNVTASTVSGNTATDEGGGIHTRYTLTLLNSTLSGNRSTAGNGGGLLLFGSSTFTIAKSTIALNSAAAATSLGGGIFQTGGTLTLDDTILATNTSAVGPDVTRLVGTTLNAKYSLIGNNAGSGLTEAPVGSPDLSGNLIGGPATGIINPLLAPLANYGGPTFTHALSTGSPALEAGDPAPVGAPAFDQRGTPYTRVFDGDGDGTPRIDIGAYENHPLSFIVDTLVDENDGDYSPGDISLREAIAMANSSSNFEDDIIQFADALTKSGPATIVLRHGELAITDSMKILGPGADRLTIDAIGNDAVPSDKSGNGSRVINIDNGNTTADENVTVLGVTLTGGDLGNGGNGAGIRNTEKLTVTASTITGNATAGSMYTGGTNYSGGGIYSSGDLTVMSTTITNNSTHGDGGGIRTTGSGKLAMTASTISGNTAGTDGGAISSTYSNITITNSSLNGNTASGQYSRGGAILFHGSGFVTTILTVTGSTISGNTASDGGGGIFVDYGRVTANLTNTTVSGNTAIGDGGGIYLGDLSLAALSVNNSTFSGNRALGSFGGGGAIYAAIKPSVAIHGSTFYDNSASSGGAIYRYGGGSNALFVDTSTFSHNSAQTNGGAIYDYLGRSTLFNSTITGNSAGTAGGGIWAHNNRDSFQVTLYHTLVAGNTVGASQRNDASGKFSLDFSLLGVDTDTIFTHNANSLVGTASSPIDPLLGPLADNGGPTKTHALLYGSRAIDSGDPSYTPSATWYDQRGEPFARVVGQIDIGAFEAQPSSWGDYNLNQVADGADYVSWRKTLNVTNLPAYSGADGNGDGTISPLDYGVWRAHFGEAASPQGAKSQVPAATNQKLEEGPASTSPIALDQIAEPVVLLSDGTKFATANIASADARQAGFATLETRLPRHDLASRLRAPIHHYQMNKPVNGDLEISLTSNGAEKSSWQNWLLPVYSGGEEHCADIEENSNELEEPFNVAFAEWS